MSCPTVKKCVGFIELASGGIIMGVLDVFLRVYLTYAIFNEDQRDIYFLLRGTREKTVVTVSPELLAFLNCICIVVTVIYLLGILAERTKFMIPGIIQTFATIFVAIFFSINACFHFLSPDDRIEAKPIILCFCATAFFFYLLIIQYSVYKATKKLVKQKAINEVKVNMSAV